jgi:hypothetical protein
MLDISKTSTCSENYRRKKKKEKK